MSKNGLTGGRKRRGTKSPVKAPRASLQNETRTHTPAPWAKAFHGFARQPSIVGRREGKPVSIAVFERGADRDLALAAPDLLLTLERTAFALDAVNIQLESWGKQSPLNVAQFLADASAVVAKATGGRS